MITPPALDGEGWNNYCKETGRCYAKDEALTSKYAEACSGVASEMGVPCVDLHTAMINQVRGYRVKIKNGIFVMFVDLVYYVFNEFL